MSFMQDIPYGYCHCGCGQKTKLAPQSNRAQGLAKGEPMRFVSGHNRRRTGPAYRVDERTGCWVWQFARNRDGYGVTSIGHKTVRAHRLMYELAKGPIPDGRQLDHLCRNRACVNPDHLEVVTPATNQQRRVDLKLDATDALVIRARYDLGERHVDIARDYGVSPSLVCLIGRRKRWASV